MIRVQSLSGVEQSEVGLARDQQFLGFYLEGYRFVYVGTRCTWLEPASDKCPKDIRWMTDWAVSYGTLFDMHVGRRMHSSDWLAPWCCQMP